MMEDRQATTENLSSAIGEYLNLRTDYFKKRIISGLATGFSRVLSSLVLMMFLLVVLAVFAFAFIILIGDATGSLIEAAFIVGGIFLIAFIVLFLFRKKLFLKMFDNLFTGMAEKGTPPDNWKSLSLILVRYLRSRIDG